MSFLSTTDEYVEVASRVLTSEFAISNRNTDLFRNVDLHDLVPERFSRELTRSYAPGSFPKGYAARRRRESAWFFTPGAEKVK